MHDTKDARQLATKADGPRRNWGMLQARLAWACAATGGQTISKDRKSGRRAQMCTICRGL